MVIVHSQGSIIAYDVLSSPEFRDLDVRLLAPLGSPLGIQEVQDQLRKLTGLRVPPGVRQITVEGMTRLNSLWKLTGFLNVSNRSIASSASSCSRSPVNGTTCRPTLT